MVQVPAATSVTVGLATVQIEGEVDAKVTVRPEDAVALIVNGALPNAWLDSAPKVIVWLPCVTWKL